MKQVNDMQQQPVQDARSLRAYLRRNIAEVYQFAGGTPTLMGLWDTALRVPTPSIPTPGSDNDHH